MSGASACPYPGLRPFTSNEADRFFGRGRQVEEMLAKLDARRFMAVVGVSGCGKSSLVRAGLIPAIEQGFLSSDAAQWRIAQMRPGGDPYGRLGESLLQPEALGPERGHGPRARAFVEAILRRGSLGLIQAVAESGLPRGTNLLLLVDQFEELFRFRDESAGSASANDADAFVRLLLDAARPPRPGEAPADTGGEVYVVLTMRSDFLGDCALFTGLPEGINDSQFLTPRLTRDQYREAIEEPARLCNGALSSALVSRLLNDMRADPDQLPVLQHALMRMWTWAAQRPGWDRRLTLADYQASEIGDLKTALSNHCDQVLAGLSKPQRHLAEAASADLYLRLLDAARRRGSGAAALWREEDLKAALEWRDKEHPSATWAERYGGNFELAMGFLEESRAEEEQEAARRLREQQEREEARQKQLKQAKELAEARARSARIARGWLLVSVVLLVGALGAVVYGYQKQQDARSHAANSEHLKKLAQEESDNAKKALVRAEKQERSASNRLAKYFISEAQRLESEIPELSLLLGVEALQASALPSVQSGLREILVTAQDKGLPLIGHEGSVNSVAFDPQGSGAGRLASAGGDGTVRVWDLNAPGGEPQVLRGHEGRVNSVAFDPQGSGAGRLASAGDDGTVRVWDLNAPGGEPQVLRGHEGWVNSVAFDPQGSGAGRLASAGGDGTVRVWDLNAPGGEPQVLRGHEGWVNSVAFDPQGSGAGRLASAGEDGTVRVWSLSTRVLARRGCALSLRNLSRSEWKKYFGDEDLHLTCPDQPIHPDYLEQGRELALAGKIEQAAAAFTRVLERFGTDSVSADPSRMAGSYVATAEVEQGDDLARSGDTEGAVSYYQRAVDLDPSWRMVPAKRAADIASWTRMQEGDRLARTGDIPAAIEAYEQALDLYPTRQILLGDPLTRAHRLAAPGIRSDSPELAKAGNLDQALADYRRAGAWHAALPMDPVIENALCWFGSLWNRAKDVLPHCERAVADNPRHGEYRDNRGVARALTGDLQGAIEDFRAWLEWEPDNEHPRDEEMDKKRRQWIEALESGRNPFDSATLEALRREEM